MSDQSRAPEWRAPPERYGPIVGMNEKVLEEGARLERLCTIGCAIAALILAALAAYLWAADLFAGHL